VDIDGRCEVVKKALVIGDESGLTRQKRRHITLSDVIEKWQEFMTHAVAAKARVVIRLVDGDRNVEQSAKFVGFATSQGKERLLP
jgi:hypothetical protein